MQQEGGRRYRILGTIGRGGFGTVYKAELLGEGGFSRLVALKVLNPDVEGVADIARRLRDEARVLGLLRHRAIVHVDGLVRLDDRWTVVMEYIRGVDLSHLVSRGPVPPRAALEIASEVASALVVAFEWEGSDGQPLRLLHRDIKPPNVLLTSAGEVKVLDFGVARAQFATREAVTTSVRFGSLGYMAPERMDLQDGPEGDVYALGAVLYELLAGAALGKSSVDPAKHAALVQGALGRLQLVQPDLSQELLGFLGTLLAYHPERRPTAREVESRCRDLAASADPPWLRELAEEVVPSLLLKEHTLGEHDFSDSILTEQSTGTESTTMAFGEAQQMPASAGMATWTDEGSEPPPPPPPAPPVSAAIPEPPPRSGPVPPPPPVRAPTSHVTSAPAQPPALPRRVTQARVGSGWGTPLIAFGLVTVPVLLVVAAGVVLFFSLICCAAMGG